MARRSGLGKGLSALIPSEATGETDSLLRVVPISHIRPNVFQPRSHFDEESMASLAASIKAVGLLQPVLVRELHDEAETYELIAGERRWRAARRAGLQTIPVLVQVADDVASLEQALVENLHRVDLNALEEAAAYQQLIDEFGLTHEQVATRMGKGRATVTNTLRLLQLPAGAQRALAERDISAGHARALLGTPDRALQEKLVQRIVDEGLTVRAVEELVREGGSELRVVPPQPEPPQPPAAEPSTTTGTTEPSGRRPPTRKLPEPGVLELEDLLSTYLNTRVKVDIQNRRGRLVVEFATLEDLERIYRAMVGDGGVA
ncbi:MAG: ParB/RepB/Spo0J family partition protein [Acidimicrobiales bacterium]|jgi:ParB family chromosome partitioning protein